MAHIFKSIPAKPAFGTLTQVVFQGDYISNKKAKLAYCSNSNKAVNCNKLVKPRSYGQYNLYNKGRYLNALDKGCILPFDKTNLIAGQYTKMELTSVCAVSEGNPCSQIDSCVGCETGAVVVIDPTTATEPFYQTNTIDPLGQLFGRAQCGINNFTRYMVYSPPTKHY
jgi:hypothetical protein